LGERGHCPQSSRLAVVLLAKIKAWIYERLAIRPGDGPRMNPGGHGWSKPVAEPRREDRPVPEGESPMTVQ
jgi:hypothetical protein